MNKTLLSGDIQRLARRLLAHEAAILSSPEHTRSAFLRVAEKLRVTLTRLAGVVGFRTLLSRALTLTKTRVPNTAVIQDVQVLPNGSLQSLDALPDNSETAEAGVLLIAQMLGLLINFIGQAMVLRLLSETWPDLSLVDSEEKQETNNDPTR